MANSYGVSSKVFRKERQKYRFEEKHFLFFTWYIKIPVDSPKKRTHSVCPRKRQHRNGKNMS